MLGRNSRALVLLCSACLVMSFITMGQAQEATYLALWRAGNPPIEENLVQGDEDSSDGISAFVASEVGKTARRTRPEYGHHYLYFTLSEKVFTGIAKKVVVQITYLDKGERLMDINYVSPEGAWIRAGIPGKGSLMTQDTNEWKTIKITLENVKLERVMRNKYDFRISGEGGPPLFIHEVRVLEIVK